MVDDCPDASRPTAHTTWAALPSASRSASPALLRPTASVHTPLTSAWPSAAHSSSKKALANTDTTDTLMRKDTNSATDASTVK